MHYRIIRNPSGLIEFVELGRDPERPPPPGGPAAFLMDSGVPVSISTDAPSVVIGTEGLSLDPEAFLQRVDEMAAERDRAREPEFEQWAEWEVSHCAFQWTVRPQNHYHAEILASSGRALIQNPITGEVWRYEPGELEWDLPFRSPCP
jgi:hypothetical protein